MLNKTGGNVSQAARLLGIGRSADVVYRRFRSSSGTRIFCPVC
nr:helix-turn-helix domain-containing protein [uncultured Brevibacillus sp.]